MLRAKSALAFGISVRHSSGETLIPKSDAMKMFSTVFRILQIFSTLNMSCSTSSHGNLVSTMFSRQKLIRTIQFSLSKITHCVSKRSPREISSRTLEDILHRLRMITSYLCRRGFAENWSCWWEGYRSGINPVHTRCFWAITVLSQYDVPFKLIHLNAY